jgi:hypothetical protein
LNFNHDRIFAAMQQEDHEMHPKQKGDRAWVAVAFEKRMTLISQPEPR